MADRSFQVGDVVQFQWSIYTKQGVVKEDRGPIGIDGRHLYRIEFHPDSLGELIFHIELPAENMELVQPAAAPKN